MKRSIKLISIFLALPLVFSNCRKEEKANQSVEPDDMLTSSTYSSMVVEIAYVEGYKPEEGSVTALTNWLEQHLHKPDGISVTYTSITSPGESGYSISEIREIEKNHRTQNTDDETLATYFFFADAPYESNSGNTQTLGVAYGPTSMCIFEETIRNYSGGLGEPSTQKVETTVMEHEFGHILGLVNNGTPMQTDHQDDEHGHHCDVEDCLMYWSVETTDLMGNLLNSPVPTLDSQCQADLEANGGK